MPHPLLEAYGSSDIGNVRPNNEDAWASLPDFPFYVLADGMGGHKAGEIAAKEAVEDLCQSLHRFLHHKKTSILSVKDIVNEIDNGFNSANNRIYQLSREVDGFKGMGTTLCCCLFDRKSIVFAHVGDSRIYRIRDNDITQLTKDHCLTKEHNSNGKKKELTTTYNHVITRAIGTTCDVNAEISYMDIMEGDIFFMCSDGLTDYISNQDILSIVQLGRPIRNTVDSLIHKAKLKGSRDNITLVMTKVEALYE